MAQGRPIRVQFPLLGVVKSTGFQGQPPYSCPDALNVWPRSSPARRGDGGRRAALAKAFQELLGGGEPVRALALVRPVATPGGARFTDEFSGVEEWGDEWSDLTGFTSLGQNNIGLTTGQIFGGAYTLDHTALRAKLLYIPDLMDTSGTWDVYFNCYVQSLADGFGLWRHEFVTRLDNAAPDRSQDCVKFHVATGHPDGTGTTIQFWTITEVVGGVETVIQTGQYSHTRSTNFTVQITRDGDVSTFLINGVQLYSGSFTDDNAKQRIAILMQASDLTIPSGLHAAAIIDRMLWNYTATTASEARADRCAAVADGTLSVESATGVLEEVAGTVTLRDDVQLQMRARLQKLFIADYSGATKANAANGATTSAVLTSATYPNFNTTGVNIEEDVVQINSGSAGVIPGTYRILSIAGGGVSITLSPDPGDGTGIDFTIERGAKVYDSDTDTLELWMATAGSVPVRCPLLMFFLGRMCLGGARGSEHLSFQSAIGDPFNFDYAAQRDGHAIAVGATPQGDTIGTPLTALVAHADDFALYGCLSELYVQRGDLGFGGRITNLSRKIGILDRAAWCWGQNGEFWFLSRSGMCWLPPQASSVPMEISRGAIPKELIQLDRAALTLSMNLNLARGGIEIYLTPNAAGASGKHWFYDLENKGFWPMAYHPDHQPFSTVNHDLTTVKEHSLLVGCRDGYIRTYNEDAQDDDGEPFASSLTLGPFMLGDSNDVEGLLQDIQAKLGEDSGSIVWQFFVGQTAEQALASSAVASGTFRRGLNPRPANVRRAGWAGYLKLSATDSANPWRFEQLTMWLAATGVQRVP